MNTLKKFVLVPESDVCGLTDNFFKGKIESENKTDYKNQDIYDDLSKILSLDIGEKYKICLFNTLLNKILDKKMKRPSIEPTVLDEEKNENSQLNRIVGDQSLNVEEPPHIESQIQDQEEQIGSPDSMVEKKIEDSLRKIIKFDKKGRIMKGAVPVKSSNIRNIAKYMNKRTKKRPSGLNLILNRLEDKKVQELLDSTNIQWTNLKKL